MYERTDYEGTMRWFGRAFDTPMYEGMPEVPTPVGEECSMCGEQILEGEAGLTMPHVLSTTDWAIMPMHVECHMRSVLGSVEHLDGLCYCTSGELEHVHGTYREQARTVMERWFGQDWKA